MSYTSIIFFVFVAAVAAVYFCIPKNFRWIVLLVASYLFYWISSSWFVLYLLTTTLSTFFFARGIGRVNSRFESEKSILALEDLAHRKKRDTRVKRTYFLIGLLLNFGMLAVLKYTDLFISIINLFSSAFHFEALSLLEFLLPLGISFYIFQSMGYLVDVYRGKYEPDKNPFKFALFVSFFPQIVQGPIGRHDDLAHQLYKGHAFDFDRIKNGVLLIAFGLIKKMVLADRLAIFVASIFGNQDTFSTVSGGIHLTAAVFASLQTYCDFSGGIDISRGVAQIFGVTLAENFNRPYFATSLAERWRRWHMTLSSWLRDYVFYPLILSKPFQKLSKNVRKKHGANWARIVPTALASFITFLLIGMWHGAELKRLVYSIWMSSMITASIILEPAFLKTQQVLKIRTKSFSYMTFMRVRTILLIAFSEFFTRLPQLSWTWQAFRSVFVNFDFLRLFNGDLLRFGLSAKDFVILLIGVGVLVVFGMLQERGNSIRDLLSQQTIWFRWFVYLLIVAILLLYPAAGNAKEFYYAQF